MAEIYVGNTGKNWYLSCEEASFSQSVANNTSTLVLVLYLRCESSAYTVSFDRRSAWIGDKSYTPAYSHSGGKHEIGRATYTFSHNADGTASFSVGYGISTSYALNGSGTYSRTIPTIPRASSISSISGNTLGSAVTVNISRASPNFTHDVTYTFGNITSTYTGQGTSCTFTPPLSDATQIPNTTSGVATIKVQTKLNGTNIGAAVSKTFTLNVPSSVTPSFTSLSITRIDNGVPAAWGIYVAGFSKATLTINGAAGAQGSTIKGYSITGVGYASADKTLTTNTLPAGTLTFTGTITDSRGRTATKNVSISVLDYAVPSLTLTAQRCNSGGTIDSNGTNVRIVPTYTFTSLGSEKNAIASKKFEVVDTSYNNTSCASGQFCILGDNLLSIANTYTIQGTVTDKLGKSATMTTTITTATKTFNIKGNGKGAAFGKMAESDSMLESAWNVKAPSFYASNWLRTTGATGWYSETYAGGIHMSDATYVRVYNGKAFYVSNTGDNALYTAGGVTAAKGKFTGVLNAGTLQQGGTAISTLIANSVNAQPQLVSVSGWDEGWKFPSGLMIIRYWSYASGTWSGWGSMYELGLNGGSNKVVPAGTFIGNPCWLLANASYSDISTGGWWAEVYGGSVSHSPWCYAVRPNTTGNYISYCIIGIGRWK